MTRFLHLFSSAGFLCLMVLLIRGNEVSAKAPTRILCLGDSLTAGYGIGKDKAYPAVLQTMVDEQGINAQVINAGVSGDTTAGGLRRINWLLKKRIDIMILALGANDGLRGQNLKATYRNLSEIIDQAREANPKVKILLAGMQVPPNMGEDYASAFKAIFQKIAKDKTCTLIPFLLEGVAGKRDLNQDDGIHPTAKGQIIIAKTVWKHLKPALN